jgi:hypothetical protein
MTDDMIVRPSGAVVLGIKKISSAPNMVVTLTAE